ncbi:MAG: hypothetical protein U9R44_04870, partial [Candidatus Omnitrophota bacterium]|nr:hypothetical protein [Candidatus Omnitrophota bacterium]
MNTDKHKVNNKNNDNDPGGNQRPPDVDLTQGISIIEIRSNQTKRIWMKAISILIAFLFFFQQTGFADIYNYKRLGGVAEEVLPSSREQDQSNRFAPAYLKRQQQKHEEILRQKMGKEDLMGQLMRRRRRREEEETPLKKKKGSGGGGEPPDYTLTQPDDLNDPHEFNDLHHENDALDNIETYDITKHPVINVDYWKQGAEKKQEEKTGLDYWIGFEGKDRPDKDRKIKEVIYFGGSEEEKIEYLLSGYVEGADEYEPKFRTEYEYSGNDISRTLKYYVEGQEDKKEGGDLVEEAYFEGSEDDNRIMRRITYDRDTGSAISCQEFIYEERDEGEALGEVRSYSARDKEFDINGNGVIDEGEDRNDDGKLGEDYDVDGDGEIDDVDGDGRIGDGILTSVTYFIGEKDREVADYTMTLSDEGEITSTIINYYRGGTRADGPATDAKGKWRDPKEYVVTYRGEIDDLDSAVDSDGDGMLDGYEDRVTSISFYDSDHRLPGEEVLDYTRNYAKGKVIRDTVYFYGEDELRAAEANYRMPLSKSVTYWGDAIDEDGNLTEDARARSATFFFIKGRLKGEEVQDYTETYLMDGETVRDTTVYFYEGDRRAEASDIDDRMERTVTYWGEGVNEDGSVKGDAKKKSETIYRFTSVTQRGEEVSDVTFNYYRDGETVRDTTVYFYEGNRRAGEATNRKGLERSATYWGNGLEEVSLLDGAGGYDPEGVKEYMKIKFGIDMTLIATKEELQNALLDHVSGGNGELIKFILDLNPEDVLNAEQLVRTLLSISGNDDSMLSLLLSVDLTGMTSKEDLLSALLISAGMDADTADMATILLTMDPDAFASSADFLKDFIAKSKAKGLSSDLIELMVLSAVLDYEGVNAFLGSLTDLAGGALKTFLESLDLEAEGITSVAELIRHLIASAAGNGYTEDDITALVLTLAAGAGEDVEGFLLNLTERAEGALKAFLEGLDLEAKGITSVAELIRHLKESAAGNGYTEDDVMLLLLSVLTDGEDINELFNNLIKVLAGSDGTLSGLIKTLLATDMNGLETADDLLNALIITAGGTSSVELKTLLNELDKTNPVSDYTTASKLLDDLLSVVDVQTRNENPDGIDLITQLRDRLNAGDLDDPGLLSAMNSLAGGKGPAELVTLLLGSDMDDALLQSLLDVLADGDVKLLNLLMGVDMTGVETAEELLDALMQIHSDDDYNDGDTSNDIPDLLEILLGTDPGDGSSCPESFVYRYEVKDDARLKSQTFFHIDRFGSELPQSISDYTLNYYRDGETIRDTTVYFYESTEPGATGDARAHSVDGAEVYVDRNSRKTRSLTYKGDARSSMLDFDGDGFSDIEEETSETDPYNAADYPAGSPGDDHTDDDENIDDGSGNTAGDGIKDEAIRRSETFYTFHDEPYYTVQGEEVADYTYAYTHDGSAIRDTTIYYYEEPLMRAQDSMVIDRKKLVVTYLDDVIAGSEYSTNGLILPGEDGIAAGALKKTETYYYFDDLTVAGDEISDFTYNYILGTENIKETVIYNYRKDDGSRDDLRADEVTRETECMSKSLTYIGDEITGPLGYPAKSITYYYSKPDSLRGDEISDYTENHTTGGRIIDRTFYKYGDNALRANDTSVYPDDALVLSETWGYDNLLLTDDALKSQSYYSGFKGEERMEYGYSYFHNMETGEDVRIQRTEYLYHPDDRMDLTRTYDIKGITDGTEQRMNNALLLNTTTYIYDTMYKYKMLTTETTGWQYLERDPAMIVGKYTTTTVYNDYQIQESSQTEGMNGRYLETENEIILGAYTTNTTYDPFGILTGTVTAGTSFNYIDTDNDGVREHVITGRYTTSSSIAVASAISDGQGGYINQINEFGVVRESITRGISGREYDSMTGGFNVLTGTYTTTAHNNKYGTLTNQVTDGESYNKIYDPVTDDYMQYTVGRYTTEATVIDGFGTVRKTVTTGGSVRLDENGDEMATGKYTTVAENNDHGTLIDQQTTGESYNKIFDPITDDYVLYTVGAYTTDAAVIDGFGTVRKTETVGGSVRLDDEGNEMATGKYTTVAENNVYGILEKQETVGESYNKIYDPVTDDYVQYTVGRYTTDATVIDGFGTVRKTVTVGGSVRLDDEGKEMATGAYTTVAENNVYGALTSQETIGESYNKIYDPATDSYVQYTVSRYTTEATVIDGFGTVRKTVTVGGSVRLDDEGNEMATGAYTTVAENNVYGALTSQETIGESYNKIYDPATDSYVQYTVGRYTTDATVIDGFGTVRKTVTVGGSVRLDDEGKEMATGAYTTVAENNVYGTLESQQTIGESYNKIYDPATDSYVQYTVSRYTTDATVIDGFGTVRKTVTTGGSVRLDDEGKEMETGAYTTVAENNVYGALTSQETVGESYNKIFDPITDDYVQYTVGRYTTDATVIDGFGTVRKTETVGGSVRLDENGDEMATGKYTTVAENNVYGTLTSQQTIGESYNKIYDPVTDSYVQYTVGAYTTDATVIDGFGTVRKTVTTGGSVRLDENGDEMATGKYTTVAGNNAYGTLTSQETVGESYNKIYDPLTDSYVLYTVGRYTTKATVIDG